MKRINIKQTDPNAFKAMIGMETYIRNSKLPQPLLELIKIRASQINGCAYCIDMHTKESLELGENQRRIFAISAWRESPLFTEKERAVLQLTEEVTMISQEGVKDETYNSASAHFDEIELAQLIMQVIIINSWNRIAVSTQQIFEGYN